MPDIFLRFIFSFFRHSLNSWNGWRKSMPFIVGDTVGPYRILEKLGRGGMATVFKGYHAALDRYVAIKALHPAFMEDPNFLARFQREARVVAKLEHSNIVPIYDFSEHEGRPYLVMKFIEGETLKARLSRGPVEQDELLKVTHAVGDALTYAHQKGILHRDVKPSNVLLGYDGRIYLADFGLARIAEMGESTLSSDKMLGTPQYISPEQAMGKSDLDEGTDIYSFGVMLYQMTTGRVPFSADTPFSVIHDHIYTPLPLPRDVNPEVPESVQRVLLKALAKERNDRYENADSLVVSFKNAVSDEEISSVPIDEFVPPEVKPVIQESVESVAAQGVVEAIEPDTPSQTKVEVPFEAVEKPKKRRRLRWWQILIIIFVSIFCCLIGIQILSNLGERQQNDQIEVQPTQLVEEETQETTIEIRDAQKLVAENPDDPYAYIQLAMANWDADRLSSAGIALKKAVDLAQGDFDVLLEIANMLGERGYWTGMAKIYLTLHEINPERFDDDLQMRFREAVYFAAESGDAEDAIPISKIAEFDEPLERVVKARYEMFHGDVSKAKTLTDDVLNNIKPGMAEAMLLQVELALASRDQALARELTAELQSRDDVYDWIKAHLNLLWKNVESDVDAAQEGSEASPDDPWVHVDMLDEAMKAGDYGAAEEEVTMIMEMAGTETDVYFAAANTLAEYGAWVYAAPLYIYSANYSDPPSGEVLERIQMALYFGASAPEAMDILLDPALGLSEAERQIVEARHTLHNGELSDAERMIYKIINEIPEMIEAGLLYAELNIKLDQWDQARETLTHIMEFDENPVWAREEARKLLEEIKQ
jgi:serine/threonine protein kinase/thioredoxin-like negative regulator of GroEL